MEFLCSFLRRHFTGKPVVASQYVGCLLKLGYNVNALIFDQFLPTNLQQNVWKTVWRICMLIINGALGDKQGCQKLRFTV